MKNVFDPAVSQEITHRIENLTPTSQPLWGKMSVAQMLAHCNVMYEMTYEKIHPKPNAFKRFVLKLIIKNYVVNEADYKHNLRTAPQFIINETKNFAQEKARLIGYIQKTQALGQQEFEGRESHSFGPLKGQEWNNMFYKHLDHHLRQFGV